MAVAPEEMPVDSAPINGAFVEHTDIEITEADAAVGEAIGQSVVDTVQDGDDVEVIA